MFCQNCGNKIKEDGKFCSVCGVEAGKVSIDETEETTSNKHSVEGAIFGQILRFVAVIVGALIGVYLGWVLLLFIFALMVGSWFPTWYLKRKHINMSLVNFIVWLNWIAWFIPPFGIMFGFATLGFAEHFPAKNKKYRTLAIGGMVVSIINAFIGILINL